MGLARHESDFEAVAEARLDLDELLGALRRPTSAKTVGRREAIAHILSGSDGWRDAATRVGGAFASLDPATGLTDGKE